MLIDTHIHLDASEFIQDRADLIAQARSAGVHAFVVPGVSVPLFADQARMISEYPDCFPAYGIHPLYVNEAQPEQLEQVEMYINRPGVLAAGEIGLDYFVADHDKARQAFFFTEQLRLARKYDLPVILHVRRSQDDVLKYLRRIPVV